MTRLARNIVDGVKRMMLDRLAIRLLPVLWLCTLWEKLTPSDSETTSLFLILGVVGLMAGAWILGALADSAPKPRQRTPYDRLHDTPRSGLAVWDQADDANLTPPPFMRALVKALGAGPGNRTLTFEVLLFIAAMALAWLLSGKSASFWADLHPRLAAQSVREAAFLAASAVVFILCLRSWATEQRRRLEPWVVGPESGFAIFVFLAAFAAFMGMIFSDLLGYGPLPGALIGAAAVVLGAALPWRGRILDGLFGRRPSPPEGAE